MKLKNERKVEVAMDAFERLQVEYDNINGTIRSYTQESIITNLLNQLRKGIDERNLDIIQYCLKGINDWYTRRINDIYGNRYSTIHENVTHRLNKELIEELYKEMSNYVMSPIKDKETSEELKQSPIIFLSHKSDDKKYGDALRNFITGLGVPDNALIYTSHPLHKIPMDRNIYEYLRENISGNVFVIILWSDAYLESPACLNEMGAAWVAQKDYTNIYVPTFSFGNPKYHQCAVDTRKMGPVLNGDEHCKMSMIELKNKIQELFSLTNDEAKSQFLLDQFMKKIAEA